MKRWHAPRAWVNGAWVTDCLLSAGGDGHWMAIEPGVTDVPQDAQRLDGPVIPGLVNAHSHAFQRAMAGLAERLVRRADGAADDFWSWRDRMYQAAMRITPAQLEAVATQLYCELLSGGYTQVCEFHYVHHAAAGQAMDDPLEMSLALVRAARRSGIGLTILPTLYMHAGFGRQPLRPDQQRFATTPHWVLQAARRLGAQGGLVNAGVALHSLRAVDAQALHEVADGLAAGMPVHIHIAEQIQEVRDCQATHGLRPIEWLLREHALGAHWNLVHATHATPDELRALREHDAAIVLCPSTEANLGDGVFDFSSLTALGGNWSVGSDSHVTRRWSEELRLLEYSQRLTRRQRNLAARGSGHEASAAALFEGALRGGRAATGLPLDGLAVGQRADFCVMNERAAALLGIPSDHLLDALVFSSPDAPLRSVFVAGQAVNLGRPGANSCVPEDVADAFAQAMRELWA